MAQQSGSLSATGSVSITNKPIGDTLTQIQVSGTYAGVSFVIEGNLDGGSVWVPLGAINNNTRGLVTGTITPGTNATASYDVRTTGFVGVRVRVTAYGSGTVNFFLNSGAFVGDPIAVPANATPASLGSAGAALTVLGTQVFDSVTNGITAFATGGQANATQLTSMVNRVTTVATAADSVRLPAATAGSFLFLVNSGANSMNVFPQTGESINALSANAAFAMAANTRAVFVCAVNGIWHAVLSA